MFLLKKRAQDSMAESLSILQELLNRQEEWVYVIDPKTHHLKLLNDAAKKLTPEAALGMICYEVLQEREEACENCPARGLQSGQKVEGFVDNKKLGIRTCIRAEEMEWKGRELCLMTVRPAEKDE